MHNYPEYIKVTATKLDCKDMDARLRGLLIRGMGKDVRYDISYNARAALKKRAEEVTSATVDLMITNMPTSFDFLTPIERVLTDLAMDQVIQHPFWDTSKFDGRTMPLFLQNYIQKTGQKLLEKYPDKPLVYIPLLANTHHIISEGREVVVPVPKTDPEVFVKYCKRLQNRKEKWSQWPFETRLIDTMGKLVLNGTLNVVVNTDKKEEKHEEDTKNESESQG